VEPIGTFQAMHECLSALSFLSALIAPIFNKIVQISLFVKGIYLFSVTFDAKSRGLEGLFGSSQTLLMVIVLAERTLQHLRIATPSITVLANPNLMPADGKRILVFSNRLIAISESVYLHQKLPRT